jgi:hypothetical protein
MLNGASVARRTLQFVAKYSRRDPRGIEWRKCHAIVRNTILNPTTGDCSDPLTRLEEGVCTPPENAELTICLPRNDGPIHSHTPSDRS